MWQSSLAAAAMASATNVALAQTKAKIKVGVLHSLSGTTAISETTLKDTILMMVDTSANRGAARQEGRSGGCRSRLELAAPCRKGARPAVQGKGRGSLRLLDLGVAQVGTAGFRGAEWTPLLPGPIRGRGKLE